MIDRETRMKLLNLDELPTLPEIIIRVLQTIDDEDSSATDLGALLEQDHVITARILRLANSAFYGFPTQVDSVQRAIVLIGYNEVRMLALATSVFDTFRQLRQYALDPHDFWLHALGVAKAAAIIAADMRGICNPQSCFTAGLLHDMGKYALAAVLQKTYKNIVADAQKRNVPLKDSEQVTLNTTHAEVGAWLAEQWCFPETLRKPIAELYTYQNGNSHDPDTLVVALADSISRLAKFGTAGDPADPSIDEGLLASLRISQGKVEQYLNTVKTHRENAEALLDILNGE